MPLSDQLRKAIQGCGKPLNQIAKEAGIPQPMLWRFVSSELERDIRLATADKLAEYFGLELSAKATKPARLTGKRIRRPRG